MHTGNGKIANLPSEIRDQLNWRLNDGEEGKELVEWLNAQPEVLEVVTKLFDGKPISEQNLSQWRTHGYRKWHAEHVILDELGNLAQNTDRIDKSSVESERLLLALKSNYGEMIQCWLITPPEQMTYRLDTFKRLTDAVLAFRRDEFQQERLAIQRERLELLREKQNNASDITTSSRPSSSRVHRSKPCETPPPPNSSPDPTSPTPPKPSAQQPAPAPQTPAPMPQSATPAPPPKPPAPTPNPPAIAATPAPVAQPQRPALPPHRDRRGKYGLL